MRTETLSNPLRGSSRDAKSVQDNTQECQSSHLQAGTKNTPSDSHTPDISVCLDGQDPKCTRTTLASHSTNMYCPSEIIGAWTTEDMAYEQELVNACSGGPPTTTTPSDPMHESQDVETEDSNPPMDLNSHTDDSCYPPESSNNKTDDSELPQESYEPELGSCDPMHESRDVETKKSYPPKDLCFHIDDSGGPPESGNNEMDDSQPLQESHEIGSCDPMHESLDAETEDSYPPKDLHFHTDYSYCAHEPADNEMDDSQSPQQSHEIASCNPTHESMDAETEDSLRAQFLESLESQQKSDLDSLDSCTPESLLNELQPLDLSTPKQILPNEGSLHHASTHTKSDPAQYSKDDASCYWKNAVRDATETASLPDNGSSPQQKHSQPKKDPSCSARNVSDLNRDHIPHKSWVADHDASTMNSDVSVIQLKSCHAIPNSSNLNNETSMISHKSCVADLDTSDQNGKTSLLPHKPCVALPYASYLNNDLNSGLQQKSSIAAPNISVVNNDISMLPRRSCIADSSPSDHDGPLAHNLDLFQEEQERQILVTSVFSLSGYMEESEYIGQWQEQSPQIHKNWTNQDHPASSILRDMNKDIPAIFKEGECLREGSLLSSENMQNHKGCASPILLEKNKDVHHAASVGGQLQQEETALSSKDQKLQGLPKLILMRRKNSKRSSWSTKVCYGKGTQVSSKEGRQLPEQSVSGLESQENLDYQDDTSLSSVSTEKSVDAGELSSQESMFLDFTKRTNQITSSRRPCSSKDTAEDSNPDHEELSSNSAYLNNEKAQPVALDTGMISTENNTQGVDNDRYVEPENSLNMGMDISEEESSEMDAGLKEDESPLFVIASVESLFGRPGEWNEPSEVKIESGTTENENISTDLLGPDHQNLRHCVADYLIQEESRKNGAESVDFVQDMGFRIKEEPELDSFTDFSEATEEPACSSGSISDGDEMESVDFSQESEVSDQETEIDTTGVEGAEISQNRDLESLEMTEDPVPPMVEDAEMSHEEDLETMNMSDEHVHTSRLEDARKSDNGNLQSLEMSKDTVPSGMDDAERSHRKDKEISSKEDHAQTRFEGAEISNKGDRQILEMPKEHAPTTEQEDAVKTNNGDGHSLEMSVGIVPTGIDVAERSHREENRERLAQQVPCSRFVNTVEGDDITENCSLLSQPSSEKPTYNRPSSPWEEPEKSMAVNEAEKSIGLNEAEKSMGVYEAEKSIGLNEAEKSMGVYEAEKSMGFSEAEKFMGISHAEKSMVVNEPEKSMGVYEPDKSMEFSEPEKSMGVYEPDKSMEFSEPEKSMGVYDQEKSMGVYEPEKSIAVIDQNVTSDSQSSQLDIISRLFLYYNGSDQYQGMCGPELDTVYISSSEQLGRPAHSKDSLSRDTETSEYLEVYQCEMCAQYFTGVKSYQQHGCCYFDFSVFDGYEKERTSLEIPTDGEQAKVTLIVDFSFKMFEQGPEQPDPGRTQSMKVYKCGRCDLQFTKKGKYKKHGKVHDSNDKPYKCACCGKKFPYAASLLTHVEKSHSGGIRLRMEKQEEHVQHPSSVEIDSSKDFHDSRPDQLDSTERSSGDSGNKCEEFPDNSMFAYANSDEPGRHEDTNENLANKLEAVDATNRYQANASFTAKENLLNKHVANVDKPQLEESDKFKNAPLSCPAYEHLNQTEMVHPSTPVKLLSPAPEERLPNPYEEAYLNQTEMEHPSTPLKLLSSAPEEGLLDPEEAYERSGEMLLKEKMEVDLDTSFSDERAVESECKDDDRPVDGAAVSSEKPVISKKSLSCQHCDKRFSKTLSLMKHMRMHNSDKYYCCDYCDKAFSHIGNLVTHMRAHTGEKPFTCEHCGKHFAWRGNLLTHIKVHTGEEPHSCDFCGKNFQSHRKLFFHRKSHAGERPHKCSLCDKRFVHRKNLEAHVSMHQGEKPFGCEYCSKRFSFSNSLKTHLRDHTGEKPYGCDHCDQKFARRKYLKVHSRLHMSENTYSCDHCDKKFMTTQSLEGHVKMHKGKKHSNRGKKGTSKGTSAKMIRAVKNRNRGKQKIINHKRNLLVTQKRPLLTRKYKCHYCDQRFFMKGRMLQHALRHSAIFNGKLGSKAELSNTQDASCSQEVARQHRLHEYLKKNVIFLDMPYKCGHCKEGFAVKDNFHEHLRFHGLGKPFNCKVCKAVFKLPQELVWHMVKQHDTRKAEGIFEHRSGKGVVVKCTVVFSSTMDLKTDPLRHKCSYCGKGFNTLCGLNRHFRTHTGEQPYQCAHCGVKYGDPSGLRAHLKKVFANEIAMSS